MLVNPHRARHRRFLGGSAASHAKRRIPPSSCTSALGCRRIIGRLAAETADMQASLTTPPFAPVSRRVMPVDRDRKGAHSAPRRTGILARESAVVQVAIPAPKPSSQGVNPQRLRLDPGRAIADTANKLI
ncbi:MAG: hypothetical protein ACJ8G1_10175 [Vitreoscilla sp.]